MIPAQNSVAWGNVVPWTDPRQVEQDLIISRALVEIFSDEMLREELRVRGGTALSKLHFAAPLRYSEDIDLVRASTGPIGPILDRLRAVLEPWLGRAKFDQSPVAPKLRFRVDAEDGSGVPIRLKFEINTREIEAFDAPAALPLNVRQLDDEVVRRLKQRAASNNRSLEGEVRHILEGAVEDAMPEKRASFVRLAARLSRRSPIPRPDRRGVPSLRAGCPS